MSDTQGQEALSVAHEAKELANRALQRQDGHEDVCAERYGNIHKTLGMILKLLGWGGTGLVSLLLVCLGWLWVHQMDSDRRNADALQTQIEVLRDRQTTTTMTTTSSPPAR